MFSNCFKCIPEGDLSDSIETGCVSIEFGNRTHRKVPVRLCSITEPIEQQSDRLGSIDFWFIFIALTTPGVFRSKSFKLLSLNLSLTHLWARIARYELKGEI